MIPMQLSASGIALIKSFESLRLTAYQDVGGVWTIGYGHTSPGIFAGMTISQADADRFLALDVEDAVECVDRKVGPQITQNQFDALTSFVFNVGCSAFCGSTMLRLLNAGERDAAALEFVKWDHVGAAVVEGLLNRREAERDLFLKP